MNRQERMRKIYSEIFKEPALTASGKRSEHYQQILEENSLRYIELLQDLQELENIYFNEGEVEA